MPVEHVGFTLKPFGFFSGNPAVDLPYAANAASKLVCCNGATTNGVHSNGVANGHANGLANGHANGIANGHANGLANGHANGVANGHANGNGYH